MNWVIVTLLVVACVVAGVTFYCCMQWIEAEKKVEWVAGWVYDAYDTGEDYSLGNRTFDIWNITLAPNYFDFLDGKNLTSYRMIFDGVAPPPEGVEIKLFYEKVDSIYRIYRVKSL